MMNDVNTTPDSDANGLAVLDNIASLVTLSQAAKLLPKLDGHHVHTSTLWRWCKNGLRGIHLEYGRMGRSIVTTPEALGRFFVALARQDAERIVLPARTRRRVRPRTSDQRQREIDQANAILVKAHILTPNPQ